MSYFKIYSPGDLVWVKAWEKWPRQKKMGVIVRRGTTYGAEQVITWYVVWLDQRSDVYFDSEIELVQQVPADIDA